jgi:hypothetical protein
MSDVERRVSYRIEMAEYDPQTTNAEPAYTHSLARLAADATLNDAVPTELRSSAGFWIRQWSSFNG